MCVVYCKSPAWACRHVYLLLDVPITAVVARVALAIMMVLLDNAWLNYGGSVGYGGDCESGGYCGLVSTRNYVAVLVVTVVTTVAAAAVVIMETVAGIILPGAA